MALSDVLTLLLLSLVLSTQALEQQKPMRRRSKRDFLDSMASFFTNSDKRLTALEARLDNNTEQRLARLEAGVEGDIQGKLLELATRMSVVESKVENATLLDAKEMQNMKMMLEDLKETTKGEKHQTEVSRILCSL